MNYGTQLMYLKDRNGLTNVKVASLIPISDSLYSRYEKEKQIIPIEHLNFYVNYYSVSLDYIFGFTSTSQYKKFKKDIDQIKSGKRLYDFRKNDIKVTQKELAKILNCSDTTISKYERGINIIATPFIYDICKKYNISADYLLGKIDHPKYLN